MKPNDIAYKLTTYDYCSITVCGKYEIHYSTGALIHAPQNTLGIMVFDTLNHLFKFLGTDYLDLRGCHIFKILMIGAFRIERPDISSITTVGYLDEFYNGLGKLYTQTSPEGTICCDIIRVLEEIPLKEALQNAQL